jgi:hypothetical protein
MTSYYKNLETLINMVESFSHDTKMEFSLDGSSTRILTFDRALTNAETDDDGNRVRYG